MAHPDMASLMPPLELEAVCRDANAPMVMLFFNRPLTVAQIITIQTLIEQHIRILDVEHIGPVQ